MKGKLKTLLVAAAAFILILAAWILVNSIDAPSFDDKGLLPVVKNVPDNENGFLDIAYIGDKDFFEKSGIDPHEMEMMVNRGDWNPKLIQKLVDDNQKLFSDIEQSTNKNYFKLPVVHDALSPMFAYGNFMAVCKLLILKSKLETQRFEFDKAIDTIGLAIIFSEKFRSEENHLVISYLAGLRAQVMMTDWVHDLASSYPLEKRQYTRLIRILDKIKPYDRDGYKEMLISRYYFEAGNIDNFLSMNVIDRIRYGLRTAKSEIDVYQQFGFLYRPSTIYIYGFMTALIPHYYIHRNKDLNRVAEIYNDMQKASNNYCNKVELRWSGGVTWDKAPTFLDIAIPDSIGQRIVDPPGYWMEYFERRCFQYTHVEGVKAVIAIKKYKTRHHHLPDQLQELVPAYIDRLPVDYFDGNTLRYSKENRWLYSIGNDYHDDHGSLLGRFNGDCMPLSRDQFRDVDQCKKNPTIPVDWSDFQDMATKPIDQ